jgi:hypothetical protein
MLSPYSSECVNVFSVNLTLVLRMRKSLCTAISKKLDSINKCKSQEQEGLAVVKENRIPHNSPLGRRGGGAGEFG